MFKSLISLLNESRRLRAQASEAEIRAAVAALNEERAREINMRYSRGNVSLQAGRYVTAKEIDDVVGHTPWRS